MSLKKSEINFYKKNGYLIKNKLISGSEDLKFVGKEQEWLTQYARKKLKENHYDYSIFGHRHLPLEIELSLGSVYFNLGDWITHYSYGSFKNDKFTLDKF